MKLLSRLFGRTNRAPAVTAAAALEQVANRPMAMAPAALSAMIAAAESADRSAYREDDDHSLEGSRPEHLVTVEGGVGYVRIHGPLFPRFDIYTWWYGGTSYDVIAAAVDMLAADAGVTQIVLDIDSNGGRVQGCFECARRIAAHRATKPITAYVNDAAFSAGYALASAANRIIITETAGVGSIGVIATHVDFSRMLENAGVRYSLVTSGEKKADLSPTAPLSDRARAELQDEVNRLGELFFALVAANRGLSVDQIRDMQAGTYFGQAAIDAGLADAVGALSLEYENDEDEDKDQPPQPVNEPEASADGLPTKEALNEAVLRLAVTDAITSASLPPAIKVALLKRQDITPEGAQEVITHAAQIADMCFAAGLPSVAAEYVERGVSVETARSELLAAKAEDGEELLTSPPKQQALSEGPSASSIRSRLRAAAGQGVTQRQFKQGA